MATSATHAVCVDPVQNTVIGAHIMLAYPPKSPAPGADVAAARASAPQQIDIVFDAVCLIEQQRAQPWRIVARTPL